MATGEYSVGTEAYQAEQVDWHGYAASYDAVTWANPAYRDLVDRVARTLDLLDLPSSTRCADLGCGTGTFTKLLVERYNEGRVFALDKNNAFLARLISNLPRQPVLEALCFNMDTDEFPAGGLDLVVSIHALCHARDPRAMLRRIHKALKPGGYVVLADIGRPLIWSDWSAYMLRELLQANAAKGWGPLSIVPTIAFFYHHRAAARVNRELSARQAKGDLWTHTLEEFVEAVRTCGFEVLEADGTLYRGVDSFAVARAREAQ